jgi:large subunit ribosomal protein L28
MARSCDLTNKGALFGNKVSHSNRKTPRKFEANLQNVSLYSNTLNSFISLRLATTTIRSVDHNGGIDSYLLTTPAAKLSAKGKVLRKRIANAQAKKAAK